MMRLFSRVQMLMKLEVDQKSTSRRRRSDEAFSCVQTLMKLEVDQKNSSLRRRSDEAFLSCAAADEAGSGSEKLFSQTSQ